MLRLSSVYFTSQVFAIPGQRLCTGTDFPQYFKPSCFTLYLPKWLFLQQPSPITGDSDNLPIASTPQSPPLPSPPIWISQMSRPMSISPLSAANGRGAAEQARRRRGASPRRCTHPSQLLIQMFMKWHRDAPNARLPSIKLCTTQLYGARTCLALSATRGSNPCSSPRCSSDERTIRAAGRLLSGYFIPPLRMNSVMAAVVDEQVPRRCRQVYFQPDEAVVPAAEILRPARHLPHQGTILQNHDFRHLVQPEG